MKYKSVLSNSTHDCRSILCFFRYRPLLFSALCHFLFSLLAKLRLLPLQIRVKVKSTPHPAPEPRTSSGENQSNQPATQFFSTRLSDGP